MPINREMVINGKEFLTVKEMANELGISPNTTKHRIFQLGIKPVSTDALYDKSTLEAIRNVPGKGRPPKAKPEGPDGAAKKNNK
jgi:predicted ArsR family transcriptional regulator